MLITKVCMPKTEYMHWLRLAKGKYGREKHIRVDCHGKTTVKVRPVSSRAKHKNFALSAKDVEIINRAFKLLGPIMEGVTNMPSLEIWRKLNEQLP